MATALLALFYIIITPIVVIVKLLKCFKPISAPPVRGFFIPV